MVSRSFTLSFTYIVGILSPLKYHYHVVNLIVTCLSLCSQTHQTVLKETYKSYFLVRPAVTRPALDPQAVLFLDNQLYIFESASFCQIAIAGRVIRQSLLQNSTFSLPPVFCIFGPPVIFLVIWFSIYSGLWFRSNVPARIESWF